MKQLMAFLALIGLLFTGCTQDHISTVKNGTFNVANGILIGKALDASFDSPKWEFFETEKGQLIVQFTGITGDRYIEYEKNIRKNKPELVEMQKFGNYWKMTFEGLKTDVANVARSFGRTETAKNIKAAEDMDAFIEAMYPKGSKVILQFVINQQDPTKFNLEKISCPSWAIDPDAEEIITYLAS